VLCRGFEKLGLPLQQFLQLGCLEPAVSQSQPTELIIVAASQFCLLLTFCGARQVFIERHQTPHGAPYNQRKQED
jgi:hypothetical protein